MSEILEHTRALRSAIDDFMGRAQDRGLVHSVGSMGALLVSATLAERVGDNLVLTPRVVAVARQRRLKADSFSTAVLGNTSLVSPMLVAADVTSQEAVDRSRPVREYSPLPEPKLTILKEVVEIAKPEHVEPCDAEFLFQRVTGGLAMGRSVLRSNFS